MYILPGRMFLERLQLERELEGGLIVKTAIVGSLVLQRTLRQPIFANILPCVDRAAVWSRIIAVISLLGIHA
jgi:hypothetical protein